LVNEKKGIDSPSAIQVMVSVCKAGVSRPGAQLTAKRRDEDHEKDNGLDGGAQNLCLTDRTLLVRFRQLGLGERGDEDGSNAHRTEPAGESGFPERLDVRNPTVREEHEWQASKQEDGDREQEEPPHGDLRRPRTCQDVHYWSARRCTHRRGGIVPIRERNDHADVDETGAVEEQIDDVGKHAVLGSLVEETAAKIPNAVRRRSLVCIGDGASLLTPKRKRFHKQMRRAGRHSRAACRYLNVQGHQLTYSRRQDLRTPDARLPMVSTAKLTY
jgi:hypothetical protein